MNKASVRSAATLRDIAKKLGVSHTTVSRALQNAPAISLERRKEIQETAQKMGYRPNAAATLLGHQRYAKKERPISSEIAWINCWRHPKDLRKHLEFDLYWKGASARAEQNGYRLEEFICNHDLSATRLEKILLARNIHGLLFPPVGGFQPLPPEWNRLKWEGFSMVRFGYSMPSPSTHLATSNQMADGQIALENMWRLGYRRIGFVANPYRWRNFKAGLFMKQAELGSNLQLSIFEYLPGQDPISALAPFSAWLKKKRPEALLTDVSQTREVLATLGYRVPEDIGLAATSILDGNALAGIDQNSEEIGKAAMETLISLMNHNDQGIPRVYREILITGTWTDGTTLPQR